MSFCSSVSALNFLIIFNKTKTNKNNNIVISNIINNKSSYVIFDCSLYTFLVRAFRRRTEKLNITTPKRVHVTKHKLGKQPMMTKTRAMLDNLYRSDTENLSRLLNDEQYLWKGLGNDSGIVGDSTIQLNNTNEFFSHQRI